MKNKRIILIFSVGIACLLIVSSYSSNNIYTNILNDVNNNRTVVYQSPKTSAAPTFSIDSPSNYSLFGKIAPNYSLTITAESGNFTWYEFIGSGVNSTPVEMEGTVNEYFEATFNQTMWNSLGNGTSVVRFYVNNSLGETGYLDAILRIDIDDPLINLIAPTGGYFNSTAPEYTIEISDPNLNTRWYTLNINQTRHIFTLNGSIDGWKYVNDGVVTITFHANDSVSNENSDSVQVTKDVVDPTGSIIINDGDTWTNSTSVTLSLTYGDATSGVLEVRYSNDGSDWSAWEAPGATRAWTLVGSDGINTVYYEVKDNASLISQFTDTIILDTVVPTGSIVINDGNTWTNSTSVTLSLTYGDATSGVLEVRYGNDGTTWTAWEAPGTTRAWTLVGVDDTKTVYYEVKDNASLISQFTDIIILDTIIPTGSIIINDGDIWTNSSDITLSLTYGDATSGVLEVRYSNDGSTWTAWEAPGATKAWALVGVDGTKTVYYEVKDNAHLISQFSDTIILDTATPTGSIIINDGDTWSNSTSVTLSLTYGDATSGVLEVRYSNDGSAWTAWEAPGATRAWTLVGVDGIKTVYYEVKDNAHLISQFTDTVILDTVAPTGSISINDGDTWTNSSDITLSLTYGDATSGVLEVRYSNDGSSWSAWEAAGATRTWTLVGVDGTKTVYYEVKDNAHLISQFTDTIILDTAAPTGSISINDGDIWTNSSDITLSLTYGDATSGVLEVRYSNDGSAWSAWEAAGATRAWTLVGVDGTKTVYYEVKDNAHLISQFTDTIILDTAAPTGSISINDGDIWTNSSDITLSLTYGDATSGVLEVRYSNDGSAWSAWEAPGATRAWTLVGVDGTKTVYYEVKDNAHLISQFTDTIILDTAAPTGSISINDGDIWTNSSDITLSLTYGDATSGVLEVRYSNDGSAWSAWEAPGATRAWTLVGVDGTKTVYYEVKDNAHLISQFTDTIILDTAAPTGSIIINDGDIWTNSSDITLSLTYGDATSGVLEVRYSNDGSAWTAWEAAGATRAWTLVGVDGTKTVYYEVKDNAHLISQFTDTIILDTAAPTGSIIINNGDTWSNSTSVTLSLTYGDATSGVLEVRYSNDGSAWTAWEAAGATRAWTLVGVDGTKTVYYEVKDNAHLISQFTDTIILDTTAPTGSIIVNDGDTWTSSNSVSLSLTYGDATSGVLEVRYSNNGSSWTAWEAPGATRAWTLSTGDGSKTVYYEVKDNVGFVSQFNDIIGLDTTNPIIVINNPTNNTYYNSPPPINITIYEPNPSVPYCTYTVTGYSPINNELDNNTQITLNQTIWIALPEGEFQIQLTSFDVFGHRTDLTITLYKDTKAPTIEINLPVNNTYWNSSLYLKLNISSFDPNSDKMWYSVNNINVSLSNNTIQQFNNSIWNSLPDEGEFELKIYANDTFGHLNNSYTLTLYKDVIAPRLIINSPLNNTYHKVAPIINVTVMDPYFHSLWYRVETQNIPLTNNTNQQLDSSVWNGLPDEGEFMIYFYANDSTGNLNNSYVLTLHRDIRNPEITINNPNLNDFFGEPAPDFEIFVSELNLNQTWYMLYNQTWNSLNYSFTGLAGKISQVAWNEFFNGNITIRFYANDTLNNLNYTEVTIRKNLNAPIITIVNPNDNDLFGIEAPNITIYKAGLELNTTWYTLDGGSTNFTFTGLSVVVNQAAWAIYGFADVTITFYINDSLGRVGFDEVTLRKDPDPPEVFITFITPSNNSYYYMEPTFRITAVDPNLDSIWYRVGNTNISVINDVDLVLNDSIWNSLPQGKFTIEVFAVDILGYMNDSLTLTFYKDTLDPIIVINQPTEYDYYKSPPPINITVYEHNLDFLIYTVVGDIHGPIPLSNNSEYILSQLIWDDLPQGEFLISITAFDDFNQNDSIVITVYKDTIAPSIRISSPLNNTFWNSSPFLNVTAIDPNLDTIWYRANSINITVPDNTLQLLNDTFWASLGEGAFTIEFFANDTFDHTSKFPVNLTLIKDTTIPQITVNSPNNSTYYSIAPTMDLTISDLNPDSIWYTVMGTKVILSGVEALNPTIWNSLGQGEFQVYIFANDSAGNLNNSVILTLYKDTLAPLVTVSLPLNNTYWSDNLDLIFNVTAYDPNLDSIYYQVLGRPRRYLTNNTDTVFSLLDWVPLPEGLFLVDIFAEDSLGNINDSIRLTLYKDTVDPVINIISPQYNEIYGEIPPNFEISISEDHLNTTWYVLIGESPIIPFTGFNGTIDLTTWNLFGNGTVTIRFYSNDTAGNTGHSDITIRKNIYAPIITINSPGDNDLFGITAPNFIIYKSGAELNTTWYTLDIGLTNITFTGLSGTINQTVWENFDFETVTIRFYINDTFGKVGFDEVSIRKDPDMPIIIVNSPNNHTAYASPPFIDLIIVEPNLDRVWYRINTNIIDITANFTQFINFPTWNSLPQGDFIVELFANDTMGNINNFNTLYLSKDTIGPNITIIRPSENQRVGRNAPTFDLLISDEHGVDLRWYTIGSGGTPREFTDLVGIIDQNLWEQIWDDLTQGEIISIRFYAEDALGNEDYKEVNLIVEKPLDLPRYLSEPLGLLISSLSLAVMVPVTVKLVKSRYYKALNVKVKRRLRKVLISAAFFLSLLTLYFIF